VFRNYAVMLRHVFHFATNVEWQTLNAETALCL